MTLMPKTTETGHWAGPRPLAYEDVRRLCGDITDEKAAAILAAGGSLEDLETAVAWAAGESDTMGEARLLPVWTGHRP